MKRFFHISFLGLNIIFLIPFLLSLLSLYVDPEKVWFLPFFGISFILWFFIQLFFVLVWIFRKKWHALISLSAILLSYEQITAFVQFHTPTPNPESVHGSFKVLTYNVRLFNLYKWNKGNLKPGSIVTLVDNQKPDIICLQEFISGDKNKCTTFDTLPGNEGRYFKHFRFTDRTRKKKYYGLAIFSHFPIIHRGDIPFPDSRNQCIYADLLIHGDTFRLYNVHFQSVYFSANNYNFVDSFEFRYDDRNVKGSLEILKLLKNGYERRARQAGLVTENIKNSPYPVIVCGDFNDTPVSYTFHTLKSQNNLVDAYDESGSGFGSTYTGLWPNFRIDYLLFDPRLRSMNFSILNSRYSDHYPITCYLTKRQEK